MAEPEGYRVIIECASSATECDANDILAAVLRHVDGTGRLRGTWTHGVRVEVIPAPPAATPDTDAALRAEVARLRALLGRAGPWRLEPPAAQGGPHFYYCRFCGAREQDGHRPDCEWVAAGLDEQPEGGGA